MTSPSAPMHFPPGYLEQDKGWEVRSTSIAFIVVLIVATFLRVCSRHIQKVGFMWADIFMPLSLIFNLGLCAVCLLTVHYGMGKHIQAVPKQNYRPLMIIRTYGAPSAYMGAVTFPKLAILDLYLNVFVDRISRRISQILVVVLVVYAVVCYIVMLNSCKPMDQSWNPVPGGHCYNIPAFFAWTGLPNIVTDLIMLLLPIPTVWRLKASKTMRLGIMATFAVGGLGLATSITRFGVFWHIMRIDHDDDATWYSRNDLIWALVEGGVYHLCACCLTFRPLLRYMIFDSPVSVYLSRESLLSKLRMKAGSSSSETSFPQSHDSPRLDQSESIFPSHTQRESKSWATKFHNTDTDNDRQGIYLERTVEVI